MDGSAPAVQHDAQAAEPFKTPTAGALHQGESSVNPPHLARHFLKTPSNEEFYLSLARFPLENPNPVLRISRQGVVLFANPASQKYFPEWQIAPGSLVPDLLRVWIDVAFLALETCPYDIQWNGHWYQWFFMPVSEAGYVNAYGFDITEQKNVEQAREEALAELERRNAELERFAYVVSHDLKAPLITISGFLDHIEHDAAAGRLDRLGDDLTRIRKAARKMRQMLDELLHLSRIGRAVNPPAAVPLADLVQEALELSAGLLDRHKVQVSVATDLPVVWGDRQRLVEVVQNLIDNAAKFMGSQPDPRIEIGVRNDNRDESCVCCVRDNGIGIEPRYQQRIFDLFEKLNPQTEGAGVGLALVKRIIEWHGGRVGVESEGGGMGSTFYFSLPPKTEEKRREETDHGS
jgi:signal transduction histidine kinase